jgi:hypothetical protein
MVLKKLNESTLSQPADKESLSASQKKKQEQLRQSKENITLILSKQKDSLEARQALKQLKNLSAIEVNDIIKQATSFLQQGGHTYEYLLGGEFIDEAGQQRGRVLVDLNIPQFVEENPFLKFLAVKFIPTSYNIANEVKVHQELQSTIKEKQRVVDFDIPVMVDNYRSKDMQMIIIEKLPRGEKDMSLQTFIEQAKRNRIATGISDEVRSKIDLAFDAIHKFGFKHGDINEGNVYLTNIVAEDVKIPQQPGKRRPKKIRMIFDADVTVLDFEKTTGLPMAKKQKQKALTQEENELEQMLDHRFIDIEPESTPEEIAEAVDEWRQAA